MLNWLRGNRRTGAERGEDRVWLDRPAMMQGIAREARRLAAAGSSVLLVIPRLSEVDDWRSAIAALDPASGGIDSGLDALPRRLGTPGAITVVHAGWVGGLGGESGPGVEMLVCGRSESRRADDALARTADVLGARARVTFHLSLDDPLLRGHAGSIKPLLDRLGAAGEQPISHAFVSRAIAKAQEQAAAKTRGRTGLA